MIAAQNAEQVLTPPSALQPDQASMNENKY